MPTAFAAAEIGLDRFVDLDRCPIHDVTSVVRGELIADRSARCAPRVAVVSRAFFDPYRMNRSYHSTTVYGSATDLHRAREQVLADGLVD